MSECYCDDPQFLFVDEGAPSYDEWVEMLGDDFLSADHDVLRTYDRDGNLIPYTKWMWIRGVANWYKIVRHDHLQADVLVSTVWLGWDHSMGMGGPPLIFETMVFGLPKWDGYTDRYSTEAEAIEGHERVLAEVRR